MLHILVIEDEANISDLIQSCAEETNSRMKVTYRFSGKAIEEITHQHLPDIVVIDMNLINISPIEVLERLKSKYPDIKIVMQTDKEDVNLIVSSIEAGASGYLVSSDVPFSDIVHAIETVHSNGALMTQNVATKVLSNFNENTDTQIGQDENEYKLTEKEKLLLQDLTEGLSYKDISIRHGITIPTVNHHIRNIYKKMHVKSRAQAVALSLRNKKDMI